MRFLPFHRGQAGVLFSLALSTVVAAQGPCARYFPDNNPAAGSSNKIPFGTSSPGILTSVFDHNVGSLGITTIYFDVTPTTHLYLQGIDLNTDVGAGVGIQADVYYRSGTHVGAENSSNGWTSWTAAKGISAALGSPSRMDFNRGIFCAANVPLGVAVVARNFSHRYSYGSASNSNASLTTSNGATSLASFTGQTYAPRRPNMTLRYQVDNANFHNQIYQTVLGSADLGGAGNITGLAFAPLQSGRHYNRELRIRMAHRTAGAPLSGNFAANIAGYTEVLHETYYTWHMRGDDWNEIGLTEPFVYNGTSDVVVEIFARGNHMTTGSPQGFHSSPTQQRLYAYGWPLNAPPTTGTYSASNGLKMRADFECAETGEFGTSCGPAHADGYSTPVAGTAYWFDIHDAPAGSPAILVMGLNLAPQSLSPFGFTNCWAWNDNIASVFKVVGSNGLAYHMLALPNTMDFDGLKIYGYWANVDATQPGGLTFTNYVRMIIGQQGFANPNQ